MENYNQDYLQHWGVQGMKWGVRRYQNKDGSLTPAGKRHYSKELERVKAAEAKAKAQQKILNTKKKTQAKIDDIEARKKAVEAHQKAMKEEEKALRSSKRKIEPKIRRKKAESIEEKRERLLNSTDPNELYNNKHLLTNDELQNRLNRINLEAQLQAKIPVVKKESTTEKLTNVLGKITKTYKSIDEAYSAVTKSSIGQQLAKSLGLDEKKNEKKVSYDVDKFLKNIDKKSPQEIQEFKNVLGNIENIKDTANKGKKTDNEIFDVNDFMNNISVKTNKEIQDVRNRLKNEKEIRDMLKGATVPDDEEDKKRDEERDK